MDKEGGKRERIKWGTKMRKIEREDKAGEEREDEVWNIERKEDEEAEGEGEKIKRGSERE